jgi:hypothetical protein
MVKCRIGAAGGRSILILRSVVHSGSALPKEIYGRRCESRRAKSPLLKSRWNGYCTIRRAENLTLKS